MAKDIRQYVDSFSTCHRVKPVRHKPYGLLQSLPQPEGARQEWTMDFITDLPPSKRLVKLRMTALMTPIGLLRMTTVPMRATNSVAQFVRVVNKILHDHTPEKARPFLDDIGVKGPKTTYNNKEIMPGIRRFVAEHIKSLDGVLADIGRAGCTASGHKSHWCMKGLNVMDYICDADSRHPDTTNINKIIDWPECRDATEARAFIGLCVYCFR